ncbi:fumarylacetoacetate hydrolase family protein [uncultured Tateyamaria sp.]|uniref:fumarylacetoacetate hydrolase family protein n=1 Tax=uncultured Tateyamaria sp. TaxID=455651 RepID=UPI00260DC750|nr:fumarylacetoacetate hydrolase family protein [uncultured Tateyamaria sp.]
MGKSILRFLNGDAPAWGVVSNGRVSPIEGGFDDIRGLLGSGRNAIDTAAAATPTRDVEDLTILSPLDITSRLFCLGLNYGDHREETGHTANKPSQMLVFGKDAGSLCGPEDDIVKPKNVALLDYEVELGLIIGSDISDPVDVDDDQLEDIVAGLVICNDVSARDDQFGVPFMQWYQAKSYRNFCPAGPFVWLPDPGELKSLYDLTVTCRVNGEVVQEAPTKNFIFTPPEAISRISRITQLRRGDCILTGTPGGVALGLAPATQALLRENLFGDDARRQAFVADQSTRGYLQDGDLVEMTIASSDGKIDLGRQKNRVIAA